MEFKRFYLMLAMAALLVLAACGNGGETAEEGAETDEAGAEESSQETVTFENKYESGPPRGEEGETTEVNETVELPKNSDKVVVYDLGVASTFKALGIEENIIGLPKGDNNASLSEVNKEFESDEYANLGGLKPDEFETLAELQPEVIMIHGRQSNTQTIDEMKAAAPDAEIVFVAADSNNYFQDIMDMTTFLGEMYDVQDKADELVADMQTKIDEVNQTVTEADKDMLFIQTNGGDLSFHGEGGRYGFLYSDLGFTSAGEQSEGETTDNHGNQVSFEFIAETNPGVMLVMDRGAAVSSGDEATPVNVVKNDVTAGVDAIENDNIIELNPQSWYLNSGGYLSGMAQLEEIEAGMAEVE